VPAAPSLPSARAADTRDSRGVFSLRLRRLPGFRVIDQRLGDGAQLAAALLPARGEASTSAGGGSSATKCARKLEGEVTPPWPDAAPARAASPRLLDAAGR